MHWSTRSEWVSRPQQQRSRNSLIAVLDTATRLFTEHGYENATIALISQESGVSAPAIYRRFTDKSAILRAIVDQWSTAWTADFERIWHSHDWSDASADAILRFHVDIMFSAYCSDPGLLREFDRQSSFDPEVAQIMAGMDAHAAERLFRMLQARLNRTDETAFRARVNEVAWTIRAALAGMSLREQHGLWPHFSIHDDSFKHTIIAMARAALDITPA